MGCRKFSCLAIFTLAFLMVFGVNALAIETTCTFNEDTQEIEVTVSDGEALDYIVHFIPDADLTNCLSPVEDSILISGPNGSGSVAVNCDFIGSGAAVEVQVCKETLCFSFYNLYFVCDENCHIRRVRDQIPTMTTWGIIILTLILLSGAVYFLRRKKVKVTV